MNGWEGELVDIVVHDLVVFKHIMYRFCERNVRISLEMVNDVLSRRVFMGHF